MILEEFQLSAHVHNSVFLLDKTAKSSSTALYFVRRSQKWFVRGCEKFVPALAYLLCPALPGSCLARFADLFWELCIVLQNLNDRVSVLRYPRK